MGGSHHQSGGSAGTGHGARPGPPAPPPRQPEGPTESGERKRHQNQARRYAKQPLAALRNAVVWLWSESGAKHRGAKKRRWRRAALVIGFAIACWQLRAAIIANEQTERALRVVQRARIDVIEARIESDRSWTNLWLSVKNYGPTDALRVHVRPWATYGAPEGSWNEDQLWDAGTFTVLAGAIERRPFRLDQFQRAKSSNIDMLISGSYSYWDEFEGRHDGSFSFVAVPPNYVLTQVEAVSGMLGEIADDAAAATKESTSRGAAPSPPLGQAAIPAPHQEGRALLDATVSGHWKSETWLGGVLVVRNVGASPAVGVRVAWTADILPTRTARPGTYKVTTEPFVLALGETRSLEFGRSFSVSEALALNIDRSSVFLVFGELTYTDGAGTDGRLPFCREYPPDGRGWRDCSRDP